ncbi:metal ABC transporter permease [Candidatus Synechococcus spongiarum]|uniref:Zinc ABC transporter, inner membrane permease protein ZnuB n=1 Tax=Candidatus Synechococcus spongiarum TaxID=431041 RepID=A0A164ZQ02_9SYNE|nr:metal ABC transporter permease [Candidatus Synechococcus spongiarum]SAY38389.1 Zinc ABC transporter, inner membrane permease protein ZnuB [Candidatus Synechococcus spongiarum]
MNWWIAPLLLALLTGALCPISGALLIVQGRVMQANLIAHAVLPGLALAVAFGLPPSVGGSLSGLLGALVAERLLVPGQNTANHSAVMNTVLAGFMGLGVLLIPLLGVRVDLEATLFGDLLLTRQVELLQVGGSLLLQGLFFAACYQPLVFLGVDPMGAAASGLPLRALKLAMAGITAFVIVSSMATVGVVLVIGLMCAPALVGLAGATSLRQAVLRASATGMALSVGGFLLALLLNLPPGPLIGVLCVGLVVVQRG